MDIFLNQLRTETNPTFFKALSAYIDSDGKTLKWDDHPILHHLDRLSEALLDKPEDSSTCKLAHRFLLEVADKVILAADKENLALDPIVWVVLLKEGTHYDHLLPLYLQEISAAVKDDPHHQRYYTFLKNLHRFFEIDRTNIRDALLKHLDTPPFSTEWRVITVLDQQISPKELACITNGVQREPLHEEDEPIYRKLLRAAFKNINTFGETYLRNALASSRYEYGFRRDIITRLLKLPEEHQTLAKEMLLDAASRFSAADKVIFWKSMTEHPQFQDELESLLDGSAGSLRDLSADHLVKTNPKKAKLIAETLIKGKKVTERLGAIALLTRLGKDSISTLTAALQQEKSSKVRDLLEKCLFKHGASGKETADKSEMATPSAKQLFAEIAADKRLKLPKVNWLNADELVLKDTSGKAQPSAVIAYVIKWQSKHKEIEPCPQIAPLLTELQNAHNHSFAFKLLAQWLESDQAAKDRWVLTLLGLFGDDTVVPGIHAGIHRWAKAQRKELAACAARSLGLLGTDSALTILDELSQKYRQKGANIGRAGGDAFLAVASERGLTLDQLRDEVAPTLGFDGNGTQSVEEDGTSLIAQLQSDFSLTWLNPETGKTTKNPPASTPASLKKRITAFRKLLRETVQNLSVRMERALITQRRWDSTTWERLFQNHPLLRHFSSQLIWASYAGDGSLTSAFRRYANGILSDHAGEMLDSDTLGKSIGIVHPLELNKDEIAAWTEHLDRQKVTPPFQQLNREIHRLDPAHHNRSELRTVQGEQCYATTLLGRMDRLGWLRGSTMEGGNVYSIFMEYPTHHIELILTLEGMEMGALAYSMPCLGHALFVKAGSVKRGSYEDDVPSSNEDCVLPLSQVPPIIYSEAINSLKALIGE